jgi:hypothetical protein
VYLFGRNLTAAFQLVLKYAGVDLADEVCRPVYGGDHITTSTGVSHGDKCPRASRAGMSSGGASAEERPAPLTNRRPAWRLLRRSASSQ